VVLLRILNSTGWFAPPVPTNGPHEYGRNDRSHSGETAHRAPPILAEGGALRCSRLGQRMIAPAKRHGCDRMVAMARVTAPSATTSAPSRDARTSGVGA